MIDIISLENVLLDFITVLNKEELKKFQKNILGILKIKNTEKINYENNNINICNYPRTKNRGLCKRRCINSIHCIYHTKNKSTKTNPDILPKRYSQNNTNIKHDLDNFQVDQVIPDNNPDKIQLESNKVDGIHSLEVNLLQDNPSNSGNPDNNILPVQNGNEEIPQNKKKNKKRKKRYLHEYKKLCIYFNEKFKRKIHKYSSLNIKTKCLFSQYLDYEKNKNKSKEELTSMLIYFNNYLVNEEGKKIKNNNIYELISYLFTFVNALSTDNYENDDFLQVMKIIYEKDDY